MKYVSSLANRVVKFTGGAIFAWLTWYSLRYTHFCMPGIIEAPTAVKDVVWKQLIFLGLVAAVWCFLLLAEKRLSGNARRLISELAILAALVWIAAAGFYWIGSADRVPNGDCAFLYGGASYFIEGDYKFLRSPGGYFAMYPHQLSLTALMEVLFRIVGAYHYLSYERISVLLAVAIVFVGYLILREISTDMAPAVMYCLTAMCCLPLIFYTSWVYGDLPSIFFSLLAAWMLLRYGRGKRWGWLAGMVASVTMAVLVRKNSMILVVALCLTAVVCLIAKKDVKLFAAAVCAAILPFLVYQGVYKLYEARSGYEHSKGIPVITWISMGLDENEGSYGWYNDSGKRMYIDMEFDQERTKEAARAHISERLAQFKKDKAYARVFFREKILSQWNAPLYQSVYFNTKYDEENMPDADSFAAKLPDEYFLKALAFCNRLQLVIYLGMLLYFIFAVKKDSDLLQHLLAVAVIGGFFFSILWEAKSRYALPYYVTMFPLAAVGYRRMFEAIGSIRRSGGQEEDREDNVIPFRKTA